MSSTFYSSWSPRNVEDLKMRFSSRTGGLSVIAVALVLTMPAAAEVAQAADPIANKQTEVRATLSRITALQQRLGTLIAEMNSIETEYNMASAEVGVTYLYMKRAEEKAAAVRELLNQRARQAYKSYSKPEASLLLGVRTMPQLLAISRFLGQSIEADGRALREALAAQESLAAARGELDSGRRELVSSTNRLDRIRSEIVATLESEQRILDGAKSELQRLEEARRAKLRAQTTGVSPAVEYRRRLRQIELDRRLADLLLWYAPGYGAEPFMPDKLRPTGIVTTGLSSWYGPGFDGRRASSGATYHQSQLTAASVVLPFGTLLKVTYGAKSVVVVITDRGPYVAGRVLDLSMGAAQAIGLSGVKQIRMEIVVPKEPAPAFP